MKNDIQVSRIQEITKLHSEIKGLFMSSLEKAFRIGFLLEEQKKSLAHGQFTSWVSQNLPFEERTARNYMRVYRKREELKRQGISVLNTAYQALTEPKEETLKEAISCLERRLNKAEFIDDPELQLRAFREMANEAAKYQQQAAEEHIRAERKCGELTRELKDGWLKLDRESRKLVLQLYSDWPSFCRLNA